MEVEMKEIHAYQNDDGTYRIEILDITKVTRTIGRKIFEDVKKCKTDIPRAGIHITAYKNKRSDGEILTVTVEE